MPNAGHAQAGRRPALVLSGSNYNGRVGLALICPITNQAKGYPFEVIVPPESGTTGVILADQVRSLDWVARSATYEGRVPEIVLYDVLGKIETLLERS